MNLNELDLPANASVEDRWMTHLGAMSATKETIGFKRKRNQDWFDEIDKITCLIEVTRHARLTFENNPSVENKRNHQQAYASCQRGIRGDHRWAA